MRHRTVGWESGAAGRHSGVAGDAVVQPEGAAEWRKASGVARTCSGDMIRMPLSLEIRISTHFNTFSIDYRFYWTHILHI